MLAHIIGLHNQTEGIEISRLPCEVYVFKWNVGKAILDLGSETIAFAREDFVPKEFIDGVNNLVKIFESEDM